LPNLFLLLPVANTPEMIDTGMDFKILKLGHARLKLDGIIDWNEPIRIASKICPLVTVAEADRMTLKSLEHLLDLYN